MRIEQIELVVGPYFEQRTAHHFGVVQSGKGAEVVEVILLVAADKILPGVLCSPPVESPLDLYPEGHARIDRQGQVGPQVQVQPRIRFAFDGPVQGSVPAYDQAPRGEIALVAVVEQRIGVGEQVPVTGIEVDR